MSFSSTKIIELGSCAFRQPFAVHSHCKLLHGYRLVAKFWFGCNALDDKNWVIDFGGLKGLKDLLEKQFDHTLVAASNDPLLHILRQLHDAGGCDLRIMDKGVGIERSAEWCFEQSDRYIRASTNDRCWVEKVEVWEHEKNSAIYTANNVVTAVTNQAVLLTEIITPQAVAQVREIEPPAIDLPPTENPRAARLGNRVTSGYSGLFDGTSWGKK